VGRKRLQISDPYLVLGKGLGFSQGTIYPFRGADTDPDGWAVPPGRLSIKSPRGRSQEKPWKRGEGAMVIGDSSNTTRGEKGGGAERIKDRRQKGGEKS